MNYSTGKPTYPSGLTQGLVHHKLLIDIAKSRKYQENKNLKSSFRLERTTYQNKGKLMRKFYSGWVVHTSRELVNFFKTTNLNTSKIYKKKTHKFWKNLTDFSLAHIYSTLSLTEPITYITKVKTHTSKINFQR